MGGLSTAGEQPGVASETPERCGARPELGAGEMLGVGCDGSGLGLSWARGSTQGQDARRGLGKVCELELEVWAPPPDVRCQMRKSEEELGCRGGRGEAITAAWNRRAAGPDLPTLPGLAPSQPPS